MIKSLLIANRGEIACRLIRTALAAALNAPVEEAPRFGVIRM